MNIDKEIFKALNLDSFTDRPLEDDEVVLVFMGTLRKAWKARAALDEQKVGPSDEAILEVADRVHQTGWDFDGVPDGLLVDFARALLSKYAAPVSKGEPVAYTSEMGEAAEAYYSRFNYAHKLPAQFRWSEVWEVMYAAAPRPVPLPRR